MIDEPYFATLKMVMFRRQDGGPINPDERVQQEPIRNDPGQRVRQEPIRSSYEREYQNRNTDGRREEAPRRGGSSVRDRIKSQEFMPQEC